MLESEHDAPLIHFTLNFVVVLALVPVQISDLIQIKDKDIHVVECVAHVEQLIFECQFSLQHICLVLLIINHLIGEEGNLVPRKVVCHPHNHTVILMSILFNQFL